MGLGIVFIIANANTGSPYKEISGRVQNFYVKTVNGLYNSNILNISTDPQDLFIFDKNALHPPLKDKFFKGEEIDIHYLDETPKTIVAFQFYDQYGNALTLYTTSLYQPEKQNPSVSSVGFFIGVGLAIVGFLMFGFAFHYAISTRRSKRSGLVSSS
ncbi:MAG: hypothetical protein ACXVDN_25430 [Ktedonobacteraceae bacterium]